MNRACSYAMNQLLLNVQCWKSSRSSVRYSWLFIISLWTDRDLRGLGFGVTNSNPYGATHILTTKLFFGMARISALYVHEILCLQIQFLRRKNCIFMHFIIFCSVLKLNNISPYARLFFHKKQSFKTT